MPVTDVSLHLPTPDATHECARLIGAQLRPGDTLLLEGQIGAGKSFFARCLIQSLQDTPEDVPSPTFTLIQTYDTRAGSIWHADLYRLNGPDGCVELGLDDALGHDICLIEWPDRLGDLTPQDALTIRLGEDEKAPDTARHLHLSWRRPRWDCLRESQPA